MAHNHESHFIPSPFPAVSDMKTKIQELQNLIGTF